MSESDLRSKEHRIYKNAVGRHGKSLATRLPKRIENRILHDDPEFEKWTYVTPHQSEAIYSSFKIANFQILPGCSHLIMINSTPLFISSDTSLLTE
jgi:hypothetical protein